MGAGLKRSLDPEEYATLRRTAGRIYAAGGSPSLSPTALLHEAWERLARSRGAYESRAHFMATAALAMRQILVDHARARGAARRRGQATHITLSGVDNGAIPPTDVLALSDALDALEARDALAARVMLLRLFGGLTVEEGAQVLMLSPRSVKRKHRFAKTYLASRLG